MLIEKAAIRVAENPVLRVGLNNHTAYKREQFNVSDSDAEGDQPTHNYYLVIASELGFVGLVLYLGFFVGVGRRAFSCCGTTIARLRYMRSPC